MLPRLLCTNLYLSPRVLPRISLFRSIFELLAPITLHRNTQRISTVMSTKRKAADAATDAAKKPKMNGSITAFFGAPKPNPNSKTAAAAKFDKDAWVAKLTEEQKDLLQLELDTLHDSWLPHLKDVLLTPQFLELKRFLKQELKSGKTVYPPMADVYSWYAFQSLPFA
jgi:hypothetical protein